MEAAQAMMQQQQDQQQQVAEHFMTLEKVKGEIVLLLSPSKPQAFGSEMIDELLIDAIVYMSFKDAISFVAKRLNISRKTVYSRALGIKKAAR